MLCKNGICKSDNTGSADTLCTYIILHLTKQTSLFTTSGRILEETVIKKPCYMKLHLQITKIASYLIAENKDSLQQPVS